MIFYRHRPITDYEQDSDENEDKDDESVANLDDRCDSNGTDNELDDNGEGVEDLKDLQKPIKEAATLPASSIQITASSYAALFTANNKEQIDSARNIIRVPAHRPQLPSVTLSANSLSNVVTSANGIISPNSADMSTFSHSLLPTSVATSQMSNIPTEFLPWTPFRPFSAALPGYLPIQAGFLGPKFGGKFSYYYNRYT